MRTLILFLLLIASPVLANGQLIVGAARAIDGDTIEIGEERIRLFGIDAPELHQACNRDGVEWPCGEEARARMHALIDGKSLRCETRARDRYGRLIATCFVGRLDIARSIVEQGFAIVPEGGPGEYLEVADRVAGFRFGIWDSEFIMPAKWRAEHPREEPEPVATNGGSFQSAPPQQIYRDATGCLIKGNHSRRGEWIYHLPGHPYYAETRAEDWFCTEADAQAAGYRPSRAR